MKNTIAELTEAARQTREALARAENEARAAAKALALAKEAEAAREAGETLNGYTIEHYGRAFSVIDPQGELLCVTLYRKGARAVIARLADLESRLARATA